MDFRGNVLNRCGFLCCGKMKESQCLVCGLEIPFNQIEVAYEDPDETRRRDEAYRLGFAIGAIQASVHPVSG
jgi:hypothetical protein